MAKKNFIIAKTNSICPYCLKVIPADLVEEKGKILIKKKCPVHGSFRDIYWSDSALYRKFLGHASDNDIPLNSQAVAEKGCPGDCGLCPEHKTNTILANLDITNRCNQACPICFANAESCGYAYEPSLSQIKKMMDLLRNKQAVPVPAIQFSGGEPTIREDLPEIISMAKKMGFAHIQLATNGIKIARSKDYAKKLLEAGLDTVYLQFDGTKGRIYEKIRGYNALPNKLRAIENCRAAGLNSIVLVPTIIRGVNEEEIGEIISFAIKNSDAVRSVNFQPVSFSGRINREKLAGMRITIPDVLKIIEEKTGGKIKASDFASVPFANAISNFISAWEKSPVSFFTIHPHCGAGTYIFLEKEKIIPVTRFVDIEEFRRLIIGQTEFLKRKSSSPLAKMRVAREIVGRMPALIDKRLAPDNLNIAELLISILKNGGKRPISIFHRDVLFIGIMHFMDAYNFDLSRVSRCGIHYVTPDERIIPFCSYNIFHRETNERKFSRLLSKATAPSRLNGIRRD